MAAMDVRSLRTALLDWYRAGHRDLPWRTTRDPYAIWLSEIMLQQTRVETVAPRYARFLARFPTVRSLAEAPLDDLLAEWAGLGYYARARNLHGAARELCERYGGQIPADVDAIRSLPGIGRYTAGAIASIAFGHEEPLLDGNVERVLCRLFLVEGDPRRAAARTTLWGHASALVRGESPGDLNQALMELGARVCSPRAPACLVCPVRRACRAREAGRVEDLPAKRTKGTKAERRLVTAVIRRSRGGLLLWRRPLESGLFAGLWELPSVASERGEDPTRAIRRLGHDLLGVRLAPGRSLGEQTQELSHLRLLLVAHEARLVAGRPRRRLAGHYDALRSLSIAEASRLGIARATARLLTSLAST